MVIAFANNQTLVLVGNGPINIYTDPVPMGDNDRLSATSNVHAIGAVGGAASLTYTGQVSNDGGQNWRDTSVTDTLTTTGTSSVVAAANGALVRFRFAFSHSGGASTDVSYVIFDLHVRLDHA